MKKVWKWFIRIISALLVGVLLAALMFPMVYKDRVVEAFKQTINDRIEGEVRFSDVDLHFISTFPSVGLTLDSFTVTGRESFAPVELLSARSVDFTLDFWSLLNDDIPYTVKSLQLVDPLIDIVLNESGVANYDITTSTDDEESSSPFQLSLESYDIVNGSISYRNFQDNTQLELRSVDHKGSGNLSADQLVLKTLSDIQSISIKQDGIYYLSDVPFNGAVDINIDNINQSYTIEKAEVNLSNLPVVLSGVFKNVDPIFVDFNVKADDADFGHMLSLLPSAFRENIPEMNFSGRGALEVITKGTYNSAVPKYPVLDVSLRVDNGTIKHKQVPKALNDIQLKADITAERGDWSDLSISLPSIKWTMDGQPSNATFYYASNDGNPSVRGSLDARTDLSDWAPYVANTDDFLLKGSLNSDIAFETNLEQVVAQKYENVNITGALSIDDFEYADVGVKKTDFKRITVTEDKDALSIVASDGRYGKSTIKSIDAKVPDILSLFNEEQIKSLININAGEVHYDDFVSEETNQTDNKENASIPALYTDVQFEAERLYYDAYTLEKVKGGVVLDNQALELKSTTATLFGDPIQVSGDFSGIMDYAYQDAELKGNLRLKGKSFDLNPLLGTEETASGSSTTEPFAFPPNMLLNMDVDFDEIIYDKHVLRKLSGQGVLKDQLFTFSDVESKFLGGGLTFKGFFNTPKDEENAFDLTVDVQKIPFQEVIQQVEMAQRLAPIMKYIDGVFNTTLKLSGNVDDQMEIDYSTLDGDGFVQTIRGNIKEIPAFQKIGETLNLNVESLIKLVDSKNWFTIEDGAVLLKPETIDLGNQAKVTVSGRTSIDRNMNYLMSFAVPREILQSSAILNKADIGLRFLEQQASKYGVNIDQGNTILVDVIVKGNLQNPSLEFKPKLSTDMSVGNILEQQKVRLQDSINQVIAQTRKRVEDSIRTVIQQTQDSIKRVAQEKIDSTKKEVEDKVETVVNEVVDSVKTEVKDKVTDKLDDLIGRGDNPSDSTSTGGKVDDAVKDAEDKLKDEIKKWNPFGKKKKE